MVRMYIPGTEYVSSIWNSAGLSSVFGDRELRRFINIFKRSRFSPVTFDTCDSKNDKIILVFSKLPKYYNSDLKNLATIYHHIYLKNGAESF